MDQVTNLQTPVSSKTRAWLKGYKEAKGLDTVGAAIAALIDEFVELKAHVAFLEED